MGRRPAAALTDSELALMEVLWSAGSATVGEVLEALPQPRPSYNSIQTRLNILEAKGYAKRSMVSRPFRYRPRVEREQVLASAVSRLVSRFFPKGSALALRLLTDQSFSEDELRQLEAAIAAKRGQS
jgi:predicted transcriptional regulator